MLDARFGARFRKDYKKAGKQGKNINLLKQVMSIIQRQLTLEEKHRDHALIGNKKGLRECHITPDWLLIYQLQIEDNTVIFIRTGSHSEVL